MFSAAQIADLAASLGSAEGLDLVNSRMESLRRDLSAARDHLSRDELRQMLCALDFLSGAIRSMEQIVRATMGQQTLRAVDCVG